MNGDEDRISLLIRKLEALSQRQEQIEKEIKELQSEINGLKVSESQPVVVEASEKAISKQNVSETGGEIDREKSLSSAHKEESIHTSKAKKTSSRTDLEKFIGENLTNKIGIGITIIGVAIGTKYAIDNQLISPMTRILLGYLVGVGLAAFALRLKKNYKNFSAVLLGGAIAIMYFITYFAYNYYSLLPQGIAFALMVIFTAAAILAAITYDIQVIAHIGLVGAYAVPFLLGEKSGNVTILFSYMAIINAGILLIAFYKYWKLLYNSSFGLTWLIFFSWYIFRYEAAEHFTISLTFISIFFATFYATFLAYKLVQKEKFQIEDIVLLIANSFVFYGIGYDVVRSYESYSHFLGLFTLVHALIHLCVSAIIYRQKLADRNLFYLVSGLVIIFITVAVPVQLNGNWVTLLWAGEATLLFWVGRTKSVSAYEKLSYILMFLASISLIQDWGITYSHYNATSTIPDSTPFLNVNFLSTVLFFAAFGYLNWLYTNQKYSSPFKPTSGIFSLISFTLPAMFIFSIYIAFLLEIVNYWNQLYVNSELTIDSAGRFYNDYRNTDFIHYKTIWIINYSLTFVSVLSVINIKKLKNEQLGTINLGLNYFFVLIFLLQGLYTLSELRDSYLDQTLAQYYSRDIFNIGIRYVSYLFIGLVIFACYKYAIQPFMKRDFKISFDFLLHISVLWIASSELINLMSLADSTQSYKLGLSILWGIYSLILISVGIWKQKQHLRIAAIVLFAFTLAKLFLYDISEMETISKTIVFVVLGILLLIISFLYNKYKHIISHS